MSALTDKLRAAATIAKAQHDATMAMADRIIAKGDEVAKLRAVAEDAHMSDMTEQLKDLQALADELNTMGNGAPPDGSSDGEKVEVVGAGPGAMKTPYFGTTPQV